MNVALHFLFVLMPAITSTTTVAAVEAFVPLDVPSDPKAGYAVVSSKRDGDMAEITTRRDGPSGVSFSTRLVDCTKQTFKYTAQTFKYTADADEEDWKKGNSAVVCDFGPLEQGSISWYVAQYACSH